MCIRDRQCSQEGEYKIPGGGQEPGENYEQTLIREVKEETGLYVRPESICELGEIIEPVSYTHLPRSMWRSSIIIM